MRGRCPEGAEGDVVAGGATAGRPGGAAPEKLPDGAVDDAESAGASDREARFDSPQLTMTKAPMATPTAVMA